MPHIFSTDIFIRFSTCERRWEWDG